MSLDIKALKKKKLLLCGQSRDSSAHISSDDLAMTLKIGSIKEEDILIGLLENKLTEEGKDSSMSLIFRSLIQILKNHERKN